MKHSLKGLAPYRKAVVTLVATVIATSLAVWRGNDPSAIPGMIEALMGVITTVLVYVLPNSLGHRN
jgi:hypothetical protein